MGMPGPPQIQPIQCIASGPSALSLPKCALWLFRSRDADSRMGMPGPPQILPQRVLHVRGVTDQEGKKAHATEHNGRENDLEQAS